jgi:hypothetical protein
MMCVLMVPKCVVCESSSSTARSAALNTLQIRMPSPDVQKKTIFLELPVVRPRCRFTVKGKVARRRNQIRRRPSALPRAG